MVPVNPKWRISPSRLKSLTEITYIAMTTHYWGKADRVDEAIKQMKKAGGSTTKVKVWAYPKASEPHFNDIGSIVYTVLKELPNSAYCVEVYSKGKFPKPKGSVKK